MALYSFEVIDPKATRSIGRFYSAAKSLSKAEETAKEWASGAGYEITDPRDVLELGTPAPEGCCWFGKASLS